MIQKPEKLFVVYQRFHLQRCCVPKDQIDPSVRQEIQRVGRNIAGLRKWRGLGQEALRDLSGVSDRQIQHMEAGSSDLGLSFHIRIARALQVPLFWLYTEDWPRFAEEQERLEADGAQG